MVWNMIFVASTLAFEVTILNPTSNSKWAPGEDVTIIWNSDSTKSDVSFNLIDLTNGNEDAPFLETIADDVNLEDGKLQYTVPKDVQTGTVGIQILSASEKPLYSSEFEIEGESAEELGESSAAIVGLTSVMAIVMQ